MTVTETRVQVQRKGSSKFVTIAGAKVVPEVGQDVAIWLPETFKLNAGDKLRTVFTVVTP
jgi:hypothetical protein